MVTYFIRLIELNKMSRKKLTFKDKKSEKILIKYKLIRILYIHV